ncbi:ATP-dependent helicase HrpB [Aureimonas mangrovi]|uniref:ATP-dependent helicase HrpB n=1 Tax=Aureimonas mangrovi TaxID=2758041 RepID=UPI00163DD2BB|nr:ATP-dependent helicase HrpB [Aureimonas mangrovi]
MTSAPDLPDLPIREVLEPLAAALGETRQAVLVAPPGAGKTTVVPLDLLTRPFLDGKRIILVEPRRLAARAAASRMADLLREKVGETVGWRMRLDTRVGPRTRIEVVTEGVFTRLILADPELSGIGAVLFDEFHERSLDGDFGLALALDVKGALRADLAILVMSATLDGARVAALLDGAPVIESAGRAFPVDIRYRDKPGTERIEDAVAAAVLDTLREEPGSVLCFLPGQREIERTAERLTGRLPANTVLAPLFGAMEAGAQDLAVRPAPPGIRKVVLATAIAETSLTIDGVRVVIDAGLSRRPVFEPATGLSRLETVRASRAAADQRAGRAGRTAPGVAIRLWRREGEAAMAAFDPPEILSADLSGLLLDCAAWGVADPASLRFLDQPPAPALAEARNLLADLGALDEGGRLTAAGEAMRVLPLPPRLARMVTGAANGAPRGTAARIAVLLTERGLGGTDIDLEERLRRWRSENGARAAGADALARRLSKSAGTAGDTDSAEPGALLALAFPDRIAVARGARGAFVLANGRGGVVDEASRLADAPMIVVAELQGQARAGRILSAAALSREGLDLVAGDRIVEEESVAFDATSRSVRGRHVRRIGRAILSQAPLAEPSPEAVASALADGIRALGLAALPFGKEGEAFRARLAFLHRTLGEPWPAQDNEALLTELEDWLMPFLPGVRRLDDIAPNTLREALAARLPAGLAGSVEAAAPSHFTAPTGSRLPIRYEREEAILPVRVQELFGLTRHPSVAGGRLPLTLELLSPAHRPIQITRDLPGFWAGSWKDVRADLRGRYPRHSWPEDPAAAAPTSRAKPRGT